jgi:PAS domain S-box-containing protein
MAACVVDADRQALHTNAPWESLKISLRPGSELDRCLSEAARIGHASCLIDDGGAVLQTEVSRVEDALFLVVARPAGESTASQSGIGSSFDFVASGTLESAADPVGCVDAAGVITYANAAFTELLSLRSDRITGRSLREFVADSHQAIWDQALGRVSRAGTVRCLVLLQATATEGASDEASEGATVELQLLSQHDGTHLVLAHSVSVEGSVGWDSTPTRSAAAELERAESQYRQVVDRSAGLILRHDAGGVLLEVNPAVARSLGYDATELVGRSLEELASPEDREATHAYLVRAVQGEARQTLRFVARDGDVRRWACDGGPEAVGESSDAGGRVTIQTHALDITPRARMEEALRVSEERYRRSLDRAADSIWMFDTDGLCLYVNESAAHLLQRERGAIVGRPFTDFVPPEEVNRAGQLLRTGLQSGGASFQTQVLRASGDRVWLELNPVELGDGTYQAIGRDMTAWLEAQESIRASEERYRRIVETAAEGMWVLDGDGNGTLANRQMTAILGYEPDGLLGRAASTLVHPAESTTLAGLLREKTAGPKDLRFLRADGSDVWCIVSATRFGGPAEDAAGTLLMVTDISERKKTEDALRASEERYRTIADSPSRGIFLSDQTGRIQFHNQQLASILDSPQLVGTRLSDLAADEDVEMLETALQVAQEATSAEVELPLRQRDQTRLVEVTLHWLSETRSLLGEVEDVTEERAMEARVRQAQQMDSVGNLAAGISHDFNNLLTVIQASLSEAASTADPTTKPLVDSAATAAHSAAQLSRQLLAIGRSSDVVREPVSLREQVDELFDLLRRAIDPNVRLVQDVPDDAVVLGSASQIQQVLMNLAVNAVDAMSKDGSHSGQLMVTVRSAVDDELPDNLVSRDGGYLPLECADTGAGMDEATARRIFEPYFSTKGEDGTGLGLAMVYGIVHEHGGAIGVVSDPGLGTTMRVYLPAVGEADRRVSSKRAMDTDRAETVRVDRPLTALVIDDRSELRAICGAVLRRAGYTVLEADGGEAALALLAGAGPAPDVALIDSSMPGLSGKETFTALRAQLPELRVVFMSGFAADTLDGLGNSDWSFLQKPFDSESLLASVAEALGDR